MNETTFKCHLCGAKSSLTNRAHFCFSVVNHGERVKVLTVYLPAVGRPSRQDSPEYRKRFGSRARAVRFMDTRGVPVEKFWGRLQNGAIA